MLSALSPASAEVAVKNKFDDWEVRCDKPAGAAVEQCALWQYVLAEERQNVGMTVLVLKLADNKGRLLRVLAPLGVLLPAGLGLRVDDANIGVTQFVRCISDGCVAEVVLDDTLLNRLKNGKQALFIIYQTPEEGIGVPISLKGFADAYTSLP